MLHSLHTEIMGACCFERNDKKIGKLNFWKKVSFVACCCLEIVVYSEEFLFLVTLKGFVLSFSLCFKLSFASF